MRSWTALIAEKKETEIVSSFIWSSPHSLPLTPFSSPDCGVHVFFFNNICVISEVFLNTDMICAHMRLSLLIQLLFVRPLRIPPVINNILVHILCDFSRLFYQTFKKTRNLEKVVVPTRMDAIDKKNAIDKKDAVSMKSLSCKNFRNLITVKNLIFFKQKWLFPLKFLSAIISGSSNRFVLNSRTIHWSTNLPQKKFNFRMFLHFFETFCLSHHFFTNACLPNLTLLYTIIFIKKKKKKKKTKRFIYNWTELSHMKSISR